MTIEELFKQQNPQDGEIPKWAKDLSVSKQSILNLKK